MPQFQQQRERVSALRHQRKQAENEVLQLATRVTARNTEREGNLRFGEAGEQRAGELATELATLNESLSVQRGKVSNLTAELLRELRALTDLGDPSQQIEQWKDTYPILLLPVRVETRFMDVDNNPELWIRIFPDDVAIHTHEVDLTQDEIEDGRAYWRVLAGAAAESPEQRELAEKGAWHALTGDHGGSRASWVAAQTRAELTAGEQDAGTAYWAEVSAAQAETDSAVRDERLADAFERLLDAFGPIRARWIAVQTAPSPSAVETGAGDVFWQEIDSIPVDAVSSARMLAEIEAWRVVAAVSSELRGGRIILSTRPNHHSIRSADDLVFRLLGHESAAPQSWSRAPRSYVMPDRFAVRLYPEETEKIHVGAAVRDPLIVGPEPVQDGTDIQQVDGDIQLGDDIAWMHDFEQAVQAGLGLRISLTDTQAATGFDRLIVVGLRMSSDVGETQLLVEELIRNHHHAPDGAALIPQGTPTNNTVDGGSGFLSLDPDPETSIAVEMGPPLFSPTANALHKSDGQRLAEAFGIEFDPLLHIAHAGGTDAAEAAAMNQALWPATLGYYFEHMLDFELPIIRELEDFFIRLVSGRGPLPALRVGEQPYGVLVTSAFERWKFPRDDTHTVHSPHPSISERIYALLARLVPVWQAQLNKVSHVGKPGDSFAHLLNILGLHATSVEFHRRHAVGLDFLYNYAQLVGENWVAENTFRLQQAFAGVLLDELGWPQDQPPSPILDLTYFAAEDRILDPLIDDVDNADDEVLTEDQSVLALYGVEELTEPQNYIGWLLNHDLPDIRKQLFRDPVGDLVELPRPLLYRLLRQGLLLSNADAAMQLYVSAGVLEESARQQAELVNVAAARTVTQWEYLDGQMNLVLPDISQEPIPIHQYVNSEEGLARPQVSGLVRVRAALERLQDLPTARLERLLAEHIDLCSYRLDAWQTALFTERLQQLRATPLDPAAGSRSMGLYLGAFGWLEDIRPSTMANAVDPATVPDALLDAEAGPLWELPGSGGFIHGPSLNHAVTAAVLRNAYLTHAEPGEQDRMAVDLSSSRVRLATQLLDGIRGGQPLGALLGYRFERNLKEKYGDPSLAQYFPDFRNAYPLLADLITPGETEEDADLKEARNVFDGYQLLEKTMLADAPIAYPYGVAGLPASGAQARAIQAEVDHMAWMLDAVKDLALAEGVYQVAQGNYDRSGAMLKAISVGTHPPEPEIAKTPRSGVAVNHRVVLHFDPAAAPAQWTAAGSSRSSAEPAINAWLATTIGGPNSIRYVVSYLTPGIDDAPPTETIDPALSVADLDIEPIDLIQLVGASLGDGDTELDRRIRNAYRVAHPELNADERSSLKVSYPPDHAAWAADTDRSLFAVLPLLTAVKQLICGARALGADDYVLPSEGSANLDASTNAAGIDFVDYKTRLDAAFANLNTAAQALTPVLQTAADTELDLAPADPGFVPDVMKRNRYVALRDALAPFPGFGFTDALIDLLPVPPVGSGEDDPFTIAWFALLDVAGSVMRQATARLAEAHRLKEFTDLTGEETTTLTSTQRFERFREAARHVLGPEFSLLPRFGVQNADELAAARDFREQALDQGLLRFSANPLIAVEWFQGTARVRERLRVLETVQTLADAFGQTSSQVRPLQLPFRATDYWIAVQYPDVELADLDDPATFTPVGDFLSIAQVLPGDTYDPTATQTGLVIDAWTEVIPNRQETTGIAVHYNQPNAEPPQVLLLAVTPVVTGNWTWDDLIAVLEETIERAKLRAVEPDQLGDSALGQILPGVLTPTTSNPDAAIAMPFDFATAVAYATTILED